MMRVLSLVAGLIVGTSSAAGWKTCTVPRTNLTDDSLAVNALLANCSKDATILFEAGKTYNISTPINFGNLTNVEISFQGNLTVPKNIPYIQNIVNSSGVFHLAWFTIGGTNVTLNGNTDPNWGWVEWHGDRWWLASGLTHPGGLLIRPYGWTLEFSNSVIKNMKVSNPIAWNFQTGGDNLTIHNNRVECQYPLDNPDYFPFNTDGELQTQRSMTFQLLSLIVARGFNLNGSNIYIHDNWVKNGDDCIVVNAGASNIVAKNNYCEGGHGNSIQLQQNGSISNVTFSGTTFVNSLYGGRFKSYQGLSGQISGITWENFKMTNVSLPLYLTQNYYDQEISSAPPAVTPSTVTTNLTNVRIANFTGTINDVNPGDNSCLSVPCWYNVVNATKTEALIFDLIQGYASDIHASDIDMSTVSGGRTIDIFCTPSELPSGTNVGYQCVKGPLVPT